MTTECINEILPLHLSKLSKASDPGNETQILATLQSLLRVKGGRMNPLKEWMEE